MYTYIHDCASTDYVRFRVEVERIFKKTPMKNFSAFLAEKISAPTPNFWQSCNWIYMELCQARWKNGAPFLSYVKNNFQLEIWGRAQLEDSRRPKSD